LVAIGFLLKLDVEVAETRVCRDKIQAGVNITVDKPGDGRFALKQLGEFFALERRSTYRIKGVWFCLMTLL
jgi:hypothetical protein